MGAGHGRAQGSERDADERYQECCVERGPEVDGRLYRQQAERDETEPGNGRIQERETEVRRSCRVDVTFEKMGGTVQVDLDIPVLVGRQLQRLHQKIRP